MTLSSPRFVSLFPAATEMLCALGLRHALVGVSHQCHLPPEVARLPRLTRSRIDSAAESAAIDAQVKALVARGEPLYELDLERLADLQPHLIVAQAHCDVCALSADAVAAALAERPALRGVRLLALNPRSLDEVLADLLRLGEAAGVARRARNDVADLRQKIDAVARCARQRPGPRPRVVVIEWIEPLMVAGNWTPELVALAGGDYGLVRSGQASPYVPWSQVQAYAPEVVVVAPCGFDLERSRREAIQLESVAAWQTLPAVRHDQVHVVDGDAHFNRPGPRLVENLQWLATILAAQTYHASGR